MRVWFRDPPQLFWERFQCDDRFKNRGRGRSGLAEMLKSAVVRHAAQLEQFRQAYVERSSWPLSLEYLAQGRVRGFYVGYDMVAGYVINASEPYRYLSLIPDPAIRTRIAESFQFGGGMCEITCFWISKGATSTAQRYFIYLCSVLDALRTGRRHFMGGSTRPAVARLQKRALSKVVFRGPLVVPGNPDGEIYMASRGLLIWNSLALIFKHYLPLLANLILRRNNDVGAKAEGSKPEGPP